MKIFNCDHNSWPICLYDFTYKNKIPQFNVFKSSHLPIEFIENYFDSPKFLDQFEEEKYESNDKEGILLERGHHYCNLE